MSFLNFGSSSRRSNSPNPVSNNTSSNLPNSTNLSTLSTLPNRNTLPTGSFDHKGNPIPSAVLESNPISSATFENKLIASTESQDKTHISNIIDPKGVIPDQMDKMSYSRGLIDSPPHKESAVYDKSSSSPQNSNTTFLPVNSSLDHMVVSHEVTESNLNAGNASADLTADSKSNAPPKKSILSSMFGRSRSPSPNPQFPHSSISNATSNAVANANNTSLETNAVSKPPTSSQPSIKSSETIGKLPPKRTMFGSRSASPQTNITNQSSTEPSQSTETTKKSSGILSMFSNRKPSPQPTLHPTTTTTVPAATTTTTTTTIPTIIPTTETETETAQVAPSIIDSTVPHPTITNTTTTTTIPSNDTKSITSQVHFGHPIESELNVIHSNNNNSSNRSENKSGVESKGEPASLDSQLHLQSQSSHSDVNSTITHPTESNATLPLSTAAPHESMIHKMMTGMGIVTKPHENTDHTTATSVTTAVTISTIHPTDSIHHDQTHAISAIDVLEADSNKQSGLHTITNMSQSKPPIQPNQPLQSSKSKQSLPTLAEISKHDSVSAVTSERIASEGIASGTKTPKQSPSPTSNTTPVDAIVPDTKVESPQPQVLKKSKPEENPEEILNEIYKRLRFLGGLSSDIETKSSHTQLKSSQPIPNLFEEFMIIFEGLEIQIRGRISGIADEDDFSEALATIGLFDESFGLSIRESTLRKIFSMYSSGEEYVDYELLVMQLLGSADPRLLPGIRTDSELLEQFHSAITGLFYNLISSQSVSETYVQKALREYFIYGGDSSKDLIVYDPMTSNNINTTTTATTTTTTTTTAVAATATVSPSNEIQSISDNERLIHWFCRLIRQAIPNLKQEEAIRLYILFHSSSSIHRSDIIHSISSAQSTDDLLHKLLHYFKVKATSDSTVSNIANKPALLRSLSNQPKQPTIASIPIALSSSIDGQHEDRIDTSVFAMDIIRLIQYDPIQSKAIIAFTKNNKDRMNDHEMYGSLRKIQRKKALKEGRVGGKSMKEKPTPEEAAIRIESCWRSKRVRKRIRLENIAASIIQTLIRRIIAKQNAKKQLKRIQKYQEEEQDRITRQRRIWRQERELMLLKNLPIDSFLTYNQMKQQNSARVLQRFWRGIVNPSRLGSVNGITMDKMLLNASKEKAKVDEEMMREVMILTSEIDKLIENSKEKEKEKEKTRKRKPEYDIKKDNKLDPSEEHLNVLRLSALQRRIQEDAKRKRKAHEDKQIKRGLRNENQNNRHNKQQSYPLNSGLNKSTEATTPVRMSRNRKSYDRKDDYGDSDSENDGEEEEENNYEKAIRKGQYRRKKYEELIELQNMSSVMLQEYLSKRPNLLTKQTERKKRLDHIKSLQQDLSSLSSLENPPIQKWIDQSKDFYSTEHIQQAAHRHVETVRVMKDLYAVNGRTSSKKENSNNDNDRSNDNDGNRTKYRKWSVVASPYDTLLPPIDISKYNTSGDIMNIHGNRSSKYSVAKIISANSELAEDWMEGRDVEESMWWVAYASQPPTYLGEGLLNQQPVHKIDKSTRKSTDKSSGKSMEKTMEDSKQSKERQLVNDLLGHVNADDLLQRLCRENIGSNHRKEHVQKIVSNENMRLNRLAQVYTDQVLKEQHLRFHNKSILSNAKQSDGMLSDSSIYERMSIRIQKMIRGYRDRLRMKYMIAERRIAIALQNLLQELTHPNIRVIGDKSNQTMQSMQTIQAMLSKPMQSILSKPVYSKTMRSIPVKSMTKVKSVSILEPVLDKVTNNEKVALSSSAFASSSSSSLSAIPYPTSSSESRLSTPYSIDIPSMGMNVNSLGSLASNRIERSESTSPFKGIAVHGVVSQPNGYVSSPSVASPSVTSPSFSLSANSAVLTSNSQYYGLSEAFPIDKNIPIIHKTIRREERDMSMILDDVLSRVLQNRELISKDIIAEAMSGDVSYFHKGQVYALLQELMDHMGGIYPLLSFLSKASSSSSHTANTNRIEIHILGILLSELLLELQIIQPTSIPSSTHNLSPNKHGYLSQPMNTWKTGLMQIGYFLRIFSAIDTIQENPSSYGSLPNNDSNSQSRRSSINSVYSSHSIGQNNNISNQIPTININENFKVTLQDIWLHMPTVGANTDSLNEGRKKGLCQDISICRSMIATRANRTKASRLQVFQGLLPTSMKRLPETYGLSDEDILGVFLRMSDIKLELEEIGFVRKYLLPHSMLGKNLLTTFGDLKEFLCSLPMTLNHRLLQMKLQILLNALPQLLGDVSSYIAISYQSSSSGIAIHNQENLSQKSYFKEVQQALWRSDCILTHSEIYALSLLLDRGRSSVGMDIGAALQRINNGQFLAAILSS